MKKRKKEIVDFMTAVELRHLEEEYIKIFSVGDIEKVAAVVNKYSPCAVSAIVCTVLDEYISKRGADMEELDAFYDSMKDVSAEVHKFMEIVSILDRM